MMKIFLPVLFLFLCLFGCSQHSESRHRFFFEDNGKIKVLSTTAMIDDLVKEIGGEYVDHLALIVGDVDPHSYELVKGDDEKIGYAQIVFGNGLNLEHGASLNYQLAQHRNAILIGNEIRKRVPDRIITTDGQLDPHVWMDISLWAEGIDSIVIALSKQDPEHAVQYERNGVKLRLEMLKAHYSIREELGEIPSERRYLVTSHDAFNYFTCAYLAEEAEWEDRCVAPEGLAPEGQLSSLDIQRVIDHLCSHRIAVVFPESNVSRDALKKIISSCAHHVYICKEPLYGDAMGMPGSDADTYLGMIQHNANILKEAWVQ